MTDSETIMRLMSGFQHAPGTPERRAADAGWIEQHKIASVKNPSRYNTGGQAFGVVSPTEHDGWQVTWPGGFEAYGSLDELLDAGWTVD